MIDLGTVLMVVGLFLAGYSGLVFIQLLWGSLKQNIFGAAQDEEQEGYLSVVSLPALFLGLAGLILILFGGYMLNR